VKKVAVLLFFVATKITKLKIILIFELLKYKIWANIQRIIELSTQKLSLSFQKYVFGIPDPGGQKGTGSRIPDPGPQH
jgi:hypothetical protein